MLGLNFFAHAVAYATTLRAVTIDEQARDADVVVEGTVVRQWYELPDQPNAFVVTRSLLAIEREYKGHVLTGQIVLTTPGGAYPDGSEDEVASAPRLDVGETVLVHVRALPGDGLVRLHNWTSGVIRLDDDASQAVLDGQGRLVTVAADGELLPIPDTLFDASVSTDAVRALVHDAVRASGTPGVTLPGYTGGAR